MLGLLDVGEGCIAVYGDSNCLDSSHMVTNCYWLLRKILDLPVQTQKLQYFFSDSHKQDTPVSVDDTHLPSLRTDVNFSTYSAVMVKDLSVGLTLDLRFGGAKGYNLDARGRSKRLPGHPVIDLGRGLNSTMDISKSRRPKDTQISKSDSLGSKYFGLLYTELLNMPVLVASHWLVPAAMAVTGLLVFLSSWRIRQKRRRREGSGSSRLANS